MIRQRKRKVNSKIQIGITQNQLCYNPAMSFLERLSIAKAKEAGISTSKGKELLPERIIEDFQKARTVIEESGLNKNILELLKLENCMEQRKEVLTGGKIDQGRVQIDLMFSKTYHFSLVSGVYEKWKGIRIEITPGGYIHFYGRRAARSSITPEEWRKRPEYIDEALGKAYNHLTTFWDKWEKSH